MPAKARMPAPIITPVLVAAVGRGLTALQTLVARFGHGRQSRLADPGDFALREISAAS